MRRHPSRVSVAYVQESPGGANSTCELGSIHTAAGATSVKSRSRLGVPSTRTAGTRVPLGTRRRPSPSCAICTRNSRPLLVRIST
eukprot:208109-Pleurochrysis_carterae.AAC.1